MDVLVIEDDATIRDALGRGLTRAGFGVRSAADGSTGLASFFAEQPDLVLLDVMLPGLDGIAVCRAIRAAGVVPVVMLTARSEDDQVIAGLEAGADDYVVKPFVPAVLFARLQAVLRRTEQRAGDHHLSVGDLTIDAGSATVQRDGSRVPVTPTEYRLLLELVRHRGGVRTRDDLLSAVWDYSWSGDSRLVDTHVQRLRAKVGHGAIETVWGQGYRIAV